MQNIRENTFNIYFLVFFLICKKFVKSLLILLHTLFFNFFAKSRENTENIESKTSLFFLFFRKTFVKTFISYLDSAKIFRENNSLVTYLVETMLSRNFCQKCTVWETISVISTLWQQNFRLTRKYFVKSISNVSI